MPRATSHLKSRALELVRTLPDHRLIDRLVRGRGWIPLLGVMLAGIVAMQVELLKLNASIGRSIGLSNALQSRNDVLRTSISSLSDADRIERLATGLGMVMPGPTSILFLDAGHVSAGKAAGSIRPPDPSSFQSALAASNAASQSQSTSASGTPTATASAPAGAPTGTSAPATTTGASSAPAAAAGPQTPGAPTTGAGTASGPATGSSGTGTASGSAGTASSGGSTTSGSAGAVGAGAAPTTATAGTTTLGVGPTNAGTAPATAGGPSTTGGQSTGGRP